MEGLTTFQAKAGGFVSLWSIGVLQHYGGTAAAAAAAVGVDRFHGGHTLVRAPADPRVRDARTTSEPLSAFACYIYRWVRLKTWSQSESESCTFFTKKRRCNSQLNSPPGWLARWGASFCLQTCSARTKGTPDLSAAHPMP